ncbi:MAG: O-antigen ligase family protein [Kiritimatiellae bacterium]|nr:O-antigen ligase family protein [Kiritimatiellia bacterium]
MLLGYNSIYIKLLVLGLALIPFVLSQIIRSRAYWLIIGFGSTMYISKIPLPLLDALSIGYVTNGVILALLFAELAIKKNTVPKIFETFPNRCMAAFAIIATARLLIDRPGTGSTGGVGGLSSALPTVLAGWCFFSVYMLAKKWEINKNQIRILFGMALLGCIHLLYQNVTRFIPVGHFISIFPYPAVWVLSFFSLSSILNKLNDKNIKYSIQGALITLGIIILSIISKNRAPIIYAPAALFVVYFCYHKVNKYIFILLLGLLTLVTITTIFPSLVPKSAKRTLSLISTDIAKSNSSEYGETGWESDWRTTLAKIAWHDIKKHPIVGTGFSFSFEELQYNALIASTGNSARFGGLLSSGGYHNSILFLAVKIGIPATLAFIFALINIYYRFVKFSQNREEDALKIFCVGISAVLMCTLGKMLTNGGPLDLFNVSIIIATMQGILMNSENYKHKELDS